MRHSKAFCAALFMLSALAAGSASAHGVRFGFHFGAPLWYPAPYYYPPPVYYYPPPVAAAPAPVYIEQGRTPAPPSEHYWYFCPDSKTYYPYVQNCASAWQRVSPRPPG